MGTLQADMQEYRKQMGKGVIPRAYRGLMETLMRLRNDLASKFPDHSVSGIYQGYMDMSYFAFTPPSLLARKLKIAIVFIHESCHFEVWLAAANKQIQSSYWTRFHDSSWTQYRLVPPGKGVDAILDHVLVQESDFNDLVRLSNQIESELLKFTKDVEKFLNESDRSTTKNSISEG